MLPISLLPRIKVDLLDKKNLYQLVSMDGLEYPSSCRLCAIAPIPDSDSDMLVCSRKNNCYKSRCFWAELIPKYDDEIFFAVIQQGSGEKQYAYTGIHRMFRIAGLNRYASLIICRASGYQCNTMCCFYSERLAAKRTATACAKAKGCNHNGSFWVLNDYVDESIQSAVQAVSNGHG